jgi:hypothetical protein
VDDKDKNHRRAFDPQLLYDRFAFWYAFVDAGDAALQSMLSLTSFSGKNQHTATFETDADSSFNMLNWAIGVVGPLVGYRREVRVHPRRIL